jgi:hypothetical protein
MTGSGLGGGGLAASTPQASITIVQGRKVEPLRIGGWLVDLRPEPYKNRWVRAWVHSARSHEEAQVLAEAQLGTGWVATGSVRVRDGVPGPRRPSQR